MTSAQRDYQDASDTGMATLAPREHDGSIRRILYIYVFDQRISVGNINTSIHIRKKMQSLILLLLLALSPSLNLAQYPPTPSGLTVVHSSVDAAVTISFKEVSISTTFSQVNDDLTPIQDRSMQPVTSCESLQRLRPPPWQCSG